MFVSWVVSCEDRPLRRANPAVLMCLCVCVCVFVFVCVFFFVWSRDVMRIGNAHLKYLVTKKLL